MTEQAAPDPRHVYRPQKEPNDALSGRKAEMLTVDRSELDDYLESGWFAHPDDFPAEPAPVADPILKLLDESAKAITENIPALTEDEINRLLAAETSGKARKGVLEPLGVALAALQPAPVAEA